LHEGLADDGPGVIDTVLPLEVGAVCGAGHRRDPVDHGVGEADVVLDPAGQLDIHPFGERQGCLAGHVTVVRQVIAGHHRKRPRAFAPTPGERRADQAEDAYRRPWIGQIMLDLRQRGVELAGAVVHAVTALGDGQRDDADGRISEPGDYGSGTIFGRQQHVAKAADHAHLGVRTVVELHQGIKEILRCQGVAHGDLIGAGADAADTPIESFTGVHQRIGVGRLMGAMKPAHADMRDTGRDRPERIGRASDVRLQLRQVLFIQLHVRPRWA